MMQPAVGDQEHMTPRDLAVDDATYVDAGLADQKASELEHDVRLRERAPDRWHQRAQRRADRRQVERLVAGEIGNTKAAAEVQQAHGSRRVQRELTRKRGRLGLRFDQTLGAQVLRAAEDVKSPDLERRSGERSQHGGYALGIDAELLRPSSHFHAGRLEFEIRIDAERDARPRAGALCYRGQTLELELGFGIDDYSGSDGSLELEGLLAGTREADLLTRRGGAQCGVELARRCD